MPSDIALGDSATVTVSLSYDLSDSLTWGANVLGIEAADLTGTEFPISLVTPGAVLEATATPPAAVVNTGVAGPIELGSVSFDVPTDQPGALQIVPGDANLQFASAPSGPTGTATCAVGSADLPIGFVIDPLAPVVDPAVRGFRTPDDRGDVDLAGDVTEGPGPIVADSWRIVRTTGLTSAAVDSAGLLSWERAGEWGDAVWEVCGLDSPPAIPPRPQPPQRRQQQRPLRNRGPPMSRCPPAGRISPTSGNRATNRIPPIRRLPLKSRIPPTSRSPRTKTLRHQTAPMQRSPHSTALRALCRSVPPSTRRQLFSALRWSSLKPQLRRPP